MFRRAGNSTDRPEIYKIGPADVIAVVQVGGRGNLSQTRPRVIAELELLVPLLSFCIHLIEHSRYVAKYPSHVLQMLCWIFVDRFFLVLA
jgi:hypothetical protein